MSLMIGCQKYITNLDPNLFIIIFKKIYFINIFLVTCMYFNYQIYIYIKTSKTSSG